MNHFQKPIQITQNDIDNTDDPNILVPLLNREFPDSNFFLGILLIRIDSERYGIDASLSKWLSSYYFRKDEVKPIKIGITSYKHKDKAPYIGIIEETCNGSDSED